MERYKITFSDESVKYIRANDYDEAYNRALLTADAENVEVDTIQHFAPNRRPPRQPLIYENHPF